MGKEKMVAFCHGGGFSEQGLFVKHRAPDRSKASFVLTPIIQGYPLCCSMGQPAKIQRYNRDMESLSRVSHAALTSTVVYTTSIFSEPMARRRHVNQTRISDHGNCQYSSMYSSTIWPSMH